MPNSLWGISAIKSFLSWVNLDQGDIGLGYQTSNEALRIAEESGDIFSKSMAYSNHGLSCICRGFFTKAEQYLSKGIYYCERINFFIWNAVAHGYLGERHFQIGEYQKSKLCYKRGVWYIEQAGFGPSISNFYKIGLIRAEVMNNEKDIDLESLYGYAEENKVRELDGQIRRYIGEILLNIDDQHLTEAEGWIKKAIEENKRNGMMWNLGRDYALYAELFKRKGDQSKAKENLNKAIEILKECGADGWVKKYEKELAALS